MSIADKTLLKYLGLNQTKAAKILEVSPQAVGFGVKCKSHYFGFEKIHKFTQYFEPDFPEKVEILKQYSRELSENKYDDDFKPKGRPPGLSTFGGVVRNNLNNLIWIVSDPFSRIVSEIDSICEILKDNKIKLFILSNDAEIMTEYLNNIFDKVKILGELHLIQTPKLLLSETILTQNRTYVNTIRGFQELNPEDATDIRKTLQSISKISPGFYMNNLNDGYKLVTIINPTVKI